MARKRKTGWLHHGCTCVSSPAPRAILPSPHHSSAASPLPHALICPAQPGGIAALTGGALLAKLGCVREYTRTPTQPHQRPAQRV